MIPKKPLQVLKTRYEKIESMRRNLQAMSANAQRHAKQAIFAAQREESASANELLALSRGLLLQGKKLTKTEPRLASEGIWRSALEEYAEALVFIQLASENKTIDWQEDLIEDPSTMLGGLSDAVGELVRLAIRAATARDTKRVERIAEQAEQLVDFLTSIDMTGPLRAKGDQARGHLRRLEDLRYDMSRNV
jgi:predicted translin family RNA/ssDNA-binding protein